LTAILAWLFFRKRLPRNFRKTVARKKWLPSEDCPALPPLPPMMLEEVMNYNKSNFDLFQQLAFSIASRRKFESKDFKLPCSGRQCLDTWGSGGPPFEKESTFQEKYVGQIVRFRARSPLAALAGSGDRFRTPSEMVSTLRNVIQLDVTAIPFIPVSQDAAEGEPPVLEATNSWILDFMMHGQKKYLAEDNNIDSSRVYKFISSFKEAIKMSITAIKAYSPSEDLVLQTFEALLAELEVRLDGGERRQAVAKARKPKAVRLD